LGVDALMCHRAMCVRPAKKKDWVPLEVKYKGCRTACKEELEWQRQEGVECYV